MATSIHQLKMDRAIQLAREIASFIRSHTSGDDPLVWQTAIIVDEMELYFASLVREAELIERQIDKQLDNGNK